MCGVHKARCQVPGCDAELTRETKVYCLQRHICKAHLEADAIYCPQRKQHMRFCMQCGKLEPLTAFDGVRRNCRAKLQRRQERRTSKAGSSRTSSSSKRSSPAPSAPLPTAAAGQRTAAEPQMARTPQQEQPLELAMTWNGVSTTTDGAMFLQQQQQQQQPMYVCPSLQAESAAVPAHPGYVAPEAAHLLKAASPTSEDFESLLFQFLEEELTAAASTAASSQFACSNSSSPALYPGAAAPGAATDRLAPGAGPHPALLRQLTLPQPASPVRGCFDGSSESSMLALAAVSPVEAQTAHSGFPPFMGALSTTQAAAAAAATVPGPSMLAAPAAAEQWTWDVHAARLAAMQDRLSRIQMQLSAMMQASLHQGCQVHQAGFFGSSAC